MTSGLFSLQDKDNQPLEESGHIVFADRVFTLEYENLVSRIMMPVDINSCSDGAPIHRVNALWDTGAASSCISEGMARRIGLQPVDMGVGITASGKIDVRYYFADLRISQDIVFRNLKISGFPLENHDADFLIGMDIISKGDFSIRSSEGKTIVSFDITK